ncbi:MAG: zinc dependent phospholipase C family protein [Clostridia bacterium]|nr:zinc dependent phospholipase C family protein [Clostridia bacterium]
MPDPYLHEHFGADVLKDLSGEITDSIDKGVFSRALQGPDPWSAIGFLGGKYKKYANRSAVMHKQKTGAFLRSCAEITKEAKSSLLYSYLCGFICHYCLDKTTHPYIIAKSGEFEGTEETYAYRGLHTRLERALDCLYIRKKYDRTPWHFCIPRETYKAKSYPIELKEPLDRLYSTVYGWEDGYTLSNAALRYESLFYTLMEDPLGILHYLFRPISNKKTDYCIFSYYKRDADAKYIDYTNDTHKEWTHPYDAGAVSRKSFGDLYAEAKAEALYMIMKAYGYVFSAEDTDLDELFPNQSYCTGFDCDDPRHENTPVYSPINYPGRYF